MYETGSFVKALQNHALTNVWSLRVPPTQKSKEVFVSAEGASGEKGRFCFKFNKRIDGIQPLVYGTGSFLKALQNHALTNV